jgi:hypothetical protein
MKLHIISLVASTALLAGASQACERPTVDNSASSSMIILAQAGGSTGGSSTGGSTSGGGSAEPGQVDPRKAPPNAPEGPKGAGGTAGGTSAGGSTAGTPAVGSNAGTGGTSGDAGPIDPRKSPPNAPSK